jgi:hypothetical protein
MVKPNAIQRLLPHVTWDAATIGWLLRAGIIQGVRLNPGCLVDPDSVARAWAHKETEGRQGGGKARAESPPTS